VYLSRSYLLLERKIEVAVPPVKCRVLSLPLAGHILVGGCRNRRARRNAVASIAQTIQTIATLLLLGDRLELGSRRLARTTTDTLGPTGTRARVALLFHAMTSSSVLDTVNAVPVSSLAALGRSSAMT